MSQEKIILRHSLIINKIEKSACNWKDIEDYLALQSEYHDYDFNISLRTFQRDLNNLRTIYGIDIQYDSNTEVYKIIEDSNQYNNRLLESLNIINATILAKNTSNFLSFEKRKSNGTEHFYEILHCIKHSTTLKIRHKKFNDDEPKEREVAPYSLKESKHRWYLIAKDLNEGIIKNFGLDRIERISKTVNKFTYPVDFKIEEHTKHSFGIVFSTDPPEEIILSFSEWQGRYVKALPLHHSQEILVDTPDEFRIKLYLCQSYDFEMELLSFGKEVTVIEPLSLKNTIKEKLKATLNNY